MRRHTALPVFLTAIALSASFSAAQRAVGIDVSYWQSSNSNPTVTSINWANVAKPVSQGGGGVEFAFIRASRGGTTGTTTSPGGGSAGTLSMRYDDPYFEDNMNKAKANGILPGAYHFARADILTNTGLDEANHFLEKAGAYMKPGYLRPVYDLESGNARSTANLTTFVMEFSDRIFEVTGVRPIVYVNTSYATSEVTSALNIHDMWLARYTLYDDGDGNDGTPRPTAADFEAARANAQTITPPTPSGYSHPYGVWKTAANPVPWDFWQYTNAGRTPGINGYVDFNVANGNIDYVKEFLVPALWHVNAGGDWSSASNWNSETYLPSAADRVIINRTAGVYNIKLNSGVHTIRSLQLNEPLEINGGTLNIAQYADLANTVTVNSGTITSASMVNTSTLTMNGGSATTGAVTGNGALLANGGNFTADSVRLGTVNLAGGAIHLNSTATSVVTSLTSTTETGSFDVGGAKLVVNYTGASPLDSIRAMIERGYASGAWDGPGLRSSDLTSATAIGFGEANLLLSFVGGTWGGINVDGTSIIISKTLKGDTDLSGTVDFDDLLALAQAYNASGTWINGDVNYDGTIDFDDLLSVAQNYGATLLASGTILASSDASFAADWQMAQSLVPEPVTMIAIVPALLLRRKR
jgi:GH25 family lysozyme M1 (1,4-beta-N-acetylmuramidase)